MTTPNIGLTELSNNQGQFLNANESFALIDALLQTRAISKSLTSAPGSPGDGDVYIMASAWSGITTLSGDACAAGDIALYRTAFGAFKAIRPKEGWKVEVAADDQVYRFDGTNWIAFTGGGMINPMTTAGDLIRGGTSGAPARVAAGTDGQVLTMVSGAPAWAPSGSSAVQSIIIACSDETTALTAGTGKVTFRMPYAVTLSAVKASLTTAQSSGSILTIDINEGGTSILSTKLTIDNTEKTSATAATAPVISDSSLASDAEITIDIDQIGDGTAKGLKVTLIGTPV